MLGEFGMVTEFSTDTVAPGDRFDSWLAFGAHSLTPVFATADDVSSFAASMRVLTLGDVQVSALRFPSLRVRRPTRLIRRSDPEAYQVNMMLSGAAVIDQADREAAVGTGEFTVYDTSRPLRALRSCHPMSPSVLVQVPRARLPLPDSVVRGLTAVPFDARHGMGGTLARWLVDLTSRADQFAEHHAAPLASMTVDLLAAAMAEPVGGGAALTQQARERALVVRIDGFIDRALGDSALTPQAVARAHHISLRRLQQLFAARGTSPAAWIRHRRLDRCRRDLVDPLLRDQPVHTVAARWGFASSAHFSRLFHATYGQPPSDYRAGLRGSARPVREWASHTPHVLETLEPAHQGGSSNHGKGEQCARS
ncbi:helix-turn-helix domain-containing protein [Actinokineospora terrae]|uniref:AraC-type DNA-binding protein n=1 Tax=Actinokineospora terrae TaxID=155974 RepID=A0A1H9KSR2_9PSEU|nr:helix-turn-helix domain-containing protein [Actinokineospora terrae]SER01925.1 AraC-type DNA-binding protein [Actinokineospora terrae]